MSQAEKTHTTKLSRRSALAGLSLLIGATVVPIAAGAADEPDCDAELLAFAAQLEPLYAEWLALMAIQQTRIENFDALLAPRMKARLGDSPYSTDEYWDARQDAIEEIRRDGVDADNEDLPWDDFHQRFFPVCDDVFSYVATTREGVALQVKTLICAEMDFWINEDGHDRLRTLVEGVCMLVGIEFPRFGASGQEAAAI